MFYTLIPVKPFEESKTRLGPVLSPEQRAILSRTLLHRTITIAQTIGPVAVVSRSYAVREAAKRWGAWSLVENKTGLNAAISQGLQWAEAKKAAAALILPLDLPLLTETDLHQIVAAGLRNSPAIVIAPCRRLRGTNALLLNPPALIAPRFGPNSFKAHQTAAQQINVTPTILSLPGLSLDLDTPADWYAALQQEFDLSPGAIPKSG